MVAQAGMGQRASSGEEKMRTEVSRRSKGPMQHCLSERPTDRLDRRPTEGALQSTRAVESTRATESTRALVGADVRTTGPSRELSKAEQLQYAAEALVSAALVARECRDDLPHDERQVSPEMRRLLVKAVADDPLLTPKLFGDELFRFKNC
ncbi:MAG: hypothetical protein KDD69_09425 [Bdellovibrionales bacterium]|nr:hypothetical protein [Bdellovibrionales bacterium]